MELSTTHDGKFDPKVHISDHERGISPNLEVPEDIRQGFTENDRRDMARLGKKQEFRRNFRFISTLGFTCCVMGTWEIMLTTCTAGLTAGGLSGLFYSMCWCYLGQAFVVFSLAEMASMAPTAGGQYHWVSEFAPRKYQRFLSYCSGWFSAISWQSIIAIDSYIVGVIIQGIVVVNDESYVPTRWQATLLIWASIILMSLFNAFAAKHLPLAEGIFVACHCLLFFPIVITVFTLAPKQSAHDVFASFTDNGAGWSNMGLTTLIGQVSAIFIVLGSDSVAHMSEEVEDAGIIVPKAMIWSFLLNIPFTFIILLMICFCIGNITDALSSVTGFPFIYIFQNATQSASGTTALTVLVLILIIMITISALASTSRQTFAFARDGGLPFPQWVGAVSSPILLSPRSKKNPLNLTNFPFSSQVHPTMHIPINSIIVTCGFTLLISLINIGSYVAFNALLSLSSTALMATYTTSVGCMTWRRLAGEPLPPSRFSLGRWGLPINICACAYSIWSFFWAFWPTYADITAQDFNWSVVLFVSIMGLASIYYWLHGRKVYEGPVVKVDGRKFI
ncbi:putative amino acid permease [Phaeomoniella chlamydospora]|uniref:Putative amino acid permease n=1 Tax=Phaeomoniella chlamydospora TaxID=158046 RepID=A0A0G2EGP9_PHACM|nr:putative amino acid permease [Phaeomoniella chlamydospora]